MTPPDRDEHGRSDVACLVPDMFWLDGGEFVAPREGQHPAQFAFEMNEPDDWKKLQRRWAIPAHRVGAGGFCYGEQGDEDGEQTEACKTCRCFQVVTLSDARALSPDDRQPIWYLP